MKHELLAPAGNLEAGYAALHYGADAVYLGLTRFSARAGAENFTADELDEFTAYAHSLGRKVFVALNTVLTEAEINELPEVFQTLRRVRVDALIVQDLGVAYLAKRLLPEIELHASTQMAVHNAEGAQFLQAQGFKRVVLARELSLAEIKAIAAATPGLDLEVFVHGALCYSYSGQCLFSALEYGKSANRGRCVYPCRSLFEKSVIKHGQGAGWKPDCQSSRTSMYAAVDSRTSNASTVLSPAFLEADEGGHLRSFEKISHFSEKSVIKHGQSAGWKPDCQSSETVPTDSQAEVSYRSGEALRTHLFSMKDLAIEEAVNEIPALSLKIEGRKKSPLYVAAVTNYYRHILDGRKKDLNEAEDIKQIFSRPWCRFHFNGKDKDITDEHFVGHRGLLIGRVERVNKGRLGFKTTHGLARYDGVQIDAKGDEKPFGFGVKTLLVNNKPVFEAKAGQYVELELPQERPHLEVGAPVYLASSTVVKGKYDYIKPKPGSFRNQTQLDITVEIGASEVWALCGEVAVSVKGCFEPAKDTLKVEEAVRTSFAKTGGTAFGVASVTVANPEGRFVPVSMLNDLRRQLLEAVAEKKVLSTEDEFVLPILDNAGAFIEKQPQALKLFYADIDTQPEDILGIESCWVVLPQICRKMTKLAETVQRLYDAGVRKFVAENYYVFKLLQGYHDVEIGAGSFLYVMNRYAVAALRQMGAVWVTLALESSAENMKEVTKHAVLPMAQVTKAHPPLFTSAVCIRPNACKDCRKGIKQFALKKDGKEYVAVSKNCQVQLFAKEAYEREAVEGITYFAEED